MGKCLRRRRNERNGGEDRQVEKARITSTSK
jgi:hypothetical protein